MRGNLWKSRNPFDRQKIILLGRAIAAKLIEDPIGFVAFHVDGDRRWAERASSENVAKFAEFVSTYVQPGVHHALRRQHDRDALATSDQDIARAAEAALARLLRLTPSAASRHGSSRTPPRHAGSARSHVAGMLRRSTGGQRTAGRSTSWRIPRRSSAWDPSTTWSWRSEHFRQTRCSGRTNPMPAAVIGLLDCADFAQPWPAHA